MFELKYEYQLINFDSLANPYSDPTQKNDIFVTIWIRKNIIFLY